jgi:hypothetical protein
VFRLAGSNPVVVVSFFFARDKQERLLQKQPGGFIKATSDFLCFVPLFTRTFLINERKKPLPRVDAVQHCPSAPLTL